MDQHGRAAPTPVGGRLPLGGRNVTTLVCRTARPARIDDYDVVSGAIGQSPPALGASARRWACRSASRAGCGAPWSWPDRARSCCRPDTEARLAGFTELVATAIANAEGAGRGDRLAGADRRRRRPDPPADRAGPARRRPAAAGLPRAEAARGAGRGAAASSARNSTRPSPRPTGALEELSEIARGIHPAVLAERRPGAGAEDARPPLAVPVDLHVSATERLPEPVEVSAYYVVAEALTNAAKHARASAVSVEVEVAGDVLRVAVRDDGAGGADLARGTGLAGLKDRVEALGGRIFLDSPRGAGTSLQAEFPLTATNDGVTSR